MKNKVIITEIRKWLHFYFYYSIIQTTVTQNVKSTRARSDSLLQRDLDFGEIPPLTSLGYALRKHIIQTQTEKGWGVVKVCVCVCLKETAFNFNVMADRCN